MAAKVSVLAQYATQVNESTPGNWKDVRQGILQQINMSKVNDTSKIDIDRTLMAATDWRSFQQKFFYSLLAGEGMRVGYKCR